MGIVKLVAGGDEIEHEARSIYRSKGFDSRPIFKENRYHDELDVLDDELSNRLALDNFFFTFVPSALINNSLPIERIDKAVTKLLNSRPRHRVKIRSRQRNTVTGSSKRGLGLKWGERPSKFILGQCRDYTPP